MLNRNVFVVKVRLGITFFICILCIFVSVPGVTIEWTDIARRVLSALDGIIKNIQSTHPSFKGMRCKYGLKCDLCCDRTNKPCERHDVKACSHGDCVLIWDLESLKKPFHKCKNNMFYCDTSTLHESAWVKATGKNVFLFVILNSYKKLSR